MIDDATIWIVIAALCAGSFAMRFSVLGLAGRRAMPEWLLRHLRYTAVAILPGLVAPMVLVPGTDGGPLDLARVVAALVTVIVGLWRRAVLSAMLAGAATFAALRVLPAII